MLKLQKNGESKTDSRSVNPMAVFKVLRIIMWEIFVFYRERIMQKGMICAI